MKKGRLLNSKVAEVIAKMGHTDQLAIGDCGLPIPDETQRIDLALEKDTPAFLNTLDVVLTELEVEAVIIANETKVISNTLLQAIKERIQDTPIIYVTHEQLKDELKSCKAVIRTGEQTPYANIILKSGVVFFRRELC